MNCEGWHSQKEEINELWKEIKEKVKNVTFKKEVKIQKWKLGRRE